MKYDCLGCKGSGLYVGFAEPEGTAVICRSCKGKGSTDGANITANDLKYYTKFTGRKKSEGIRRVWIDGGLWMMREASSISCTIPISDFYSKVPE